MKQFDRKFNEIIFQVLTEHQEKDLRNEKVKLEIASDIFEKWKNYQKELLESVAGKKALEQLSNRMNSGILTGPSDIDLNKFKR